MLYARHEKEKRNMDREAKAAKEVEGLVTIDAGAPPVLAPHLTPQGALMPLRFVGGVLPPAWRAAFQAAAESGELSFPYAKFSCTRDTAALFAALCRLNPFATVMYLTPTPYLVRGEAEPVRLPGTSGTGLQGFVNHGALVCLRIVREAGRLVSGYSEPARVKATRKGTEAALTLWTREAGEIVAAAVARGSGTVTRRGLAVATWAKIGFSEVTAFPPEVARTCYMLFGAKRVLDPCGGWGDRLAAALSLAPHLQLYVCTDPNPAVHAAYAAMVAELGPLVGADPANYVCMCTPFEDVPLRDEPGGAGLAINAAPFDLIFTSPPFFDLEVYAHDAAQSVARYAPSPAASGGGGGGGGSGGGGMSTAEPVAVAVTGAVAGAIAGSKRARDTESNEQEKEKEKERIFALAHGETDAETARLRAWVWGFLRLLLQRAWARLRAGGHMVLSINDYAGVQYIRAMLALADALPGVRFLGVLGMDLTASATYDGHVKAPLFVWQRV